MFRFCRNRRVRILQEKSNIESRNSNLSLLLKFTCLITLSAFFMIYAGTFDCFSGFLMTFVVKQLKWTKRMGLLLTSAYWAAFATSRGLAVLVAKLLTPDKMIFANYFIMTSALLGILFGSADTSVAMWVCTLLVGLAMSSTFPAAFTWVERELFKVSGFLSAFFILSASSGTIVLPVLLGYLFQEHSSMWYVYLVLGGGVVCSFLFSILVILAKCKTRDLEIDNELGVIDSDKSKAEKLLKPVEKS